LKEWYELAGRREDVWCQQDRLISPDEIRRNEGVLQFYVENQGVTAWGVQLGDLALDDPPVVMRDYPQIIKKGGETAEWTPHSLTVSQFALHMFAYATQFGAPIVVSGYAQESIIKRILTEIPTLGFPEFLWPGGEFRIYGVADLIVTVDSTNHVNAAGLNEEALEPFRA
jgi:hypothetical protein